MALKRAKITHSSSEAPRDRGTNTRLILPMQFNTASAEITSSIRNNWNTLAPGSEFTSALATGTSLTAGKHEDHLCCFSQMIIQFFYSGKLVSHITTTRPEGCRISLSQHLPGGEKVYDMENLENIRFPSAEYIASERQKQITRKLFGHLDRGVLLYSNKEGVFIKRLCQGRVFWSGNCMPYKDRPNKLDRDEIVKIFDTNMYIRELQHCYSQGRIPESRITLCFGEEFPDATPLQLKLIIVQIEQLGVRQLTEEAVKSYSSASLHLHQDPQMDQIPRIISDACTPHQRSFYRESQQITV
ncbi:interferon regulatory factor 8 [Pelobates cultripes]|uniref:Interferon regulatory factor 8 n=1 Tax=Pelobates cultripes TaxID=61616 RepID=A0AAD1S7K4_PELCU|nr:interferon regulatory factor 8 [Pelobates cultripes]